MRSSQRARITAHLQGMNPSTHESRWGSLAGTNLRKKQFGTSANATKHQHFAALDGWRGICACLVALYHFPVYSNLYDLAFIRNAYLFVDFFFVLSGFVITASYSQRLTDGKAFSVFMLRRLGRLYPLHLFVLVLWVALEAAKWVALTQGLGQFTNPPFTNTTSTESLGLNLLMLHSFGLTDYLSWNYPSWSISSELAAYLCFGLCTWWLRQTWLVYACVILVAPWLIYQQEGNMYVTYDYGYLRCLMGFFSGVFIYKCYQHLKQISTKAWSLITATLLELIVVTIAWGFVSWVDKTALSILAPFVFAPMVFVFAFQAGLISKILSTGPLILIGALSYSIYMIHALVQELFKLVFLGVLPQLTGRSWATPSEEGPLIGLTIPQGDVLHIAMLALVIAISYITWRVIELPAKSWANRRIHQRLGKASSN